jgi:hypothetical protein
MKALAIITVLLLCLTICSAKSATNDFPVNDDAGIVEQRNAAIASDSLGNIVIVWQDSRNGAEDIYGQKYDRNGSPIGTNFKIDDAGESITQRYPDVDMTPSGEFVVVWMDYRNQNRDIFAKIYNNTGNPIGPDFMVNDNADNTDQNWPQVAINPSGKIIMVWCDWRVHGVGGDPHIFAQVYNIDGTPSGPNFRVDDDTTFNGWRVFPSVDIDSSGAFVVTWYDFRDGPPRVFAQRYDKNNNPVGVNFRVCENRFSFEPSIALKPGGDFIIAWPGDDNDATYYIFAKRYDHNGLLIDAFTVETGIPDSSYFAYPYVTYGPSDEFIICWQETRDGYRDIYARKYDQNGDPVDEKFMVNDPDFAEYEQSHPKAIPADSLLAFVWDDNRNDEDCDIFAKIVNWKYKGYFCGDANNDFEVNISDAVWIINYVFQGGLPPDPLESGECNCDGDVNISDAVWIINYVFMGGNEPCDSDGDGIPDC